MFLIFGAGIVQGTYAGFLPLSGEMSDGEQFFFRQGMGNHSHRNIFALFLSSFCFLFFTFVWFQEDILQFRFRECGSRSMVISASLKAKQR